MVQLTPHLKTLVYRAFGQVLSPIYSGIGSIVMLHRVVDSGRQSRERLGWCSSIEASTAELEALVALFRQQLYAFLTLDEVQDILSSGRKTPKFVSFTFDDGYRDVLTKGLPILDAAKVPFTLYLTTGYPERTLVPWWYLLEELLLRQRQVDFEHAGRSWHFEPRDHAQRERAFNQIAALFDLGSASEAVRLAEKLFGVKEVAQATEDLFLSWSQVKQLAAHPLVTIGSHTMLHPALNTLGRDEALREMRDARKQTEEHLDRKVRHFTYPFGSSLQVGPREFELARECGFATATTTRLGNLFADHRNHLMCLPRIYAQSRDQLALSRTGVVSAFRYRGRRVITD